MRHLHQLEPVRFMLQMNAVHTIHTPRSGNAGGFQNRGAVLLVVLHNVPINGGIGNAGHFQIPQNIFFQPERKGLTERSFTLEAIAAKLDPGLLPQLAFAGQDTRNRVPPGLLFKLVQRRFFHVVTASCRNFERSIQKVFVVLAVIDRLLSVLVQQFSIDSCQTVRLSLSCAIDNIRNLFGDDRIAVFLNNLRKRIARAKPGHIVFRFHEIAQFGVFQPRVNIHGWNVRINPTCQIKQHSRVFAAGKADKDLPIVPHIPFHDSRLRNSNFSIEAPPLHDYQILPGVLHT